MRRYIYDNVVLNTLDKWYAFAIISAQCHDEVTIKRYDMDLFRTLSKPWNILEYIIEKTAIGIVVNQA
jgi:hypothetical protein